MKKIIINLGFGRKNWDYTSESVDSQARKSEGNQIFYAGSDL